MRGSRAILNAFRLAPKIADKIVPQPLVTFKKAVADSSYAGWSYPTEVQVPAVVDWRQRQVRTKSGVLEVSRAHVLFLNIADVIRMTNGEGISENDVIILPDGDTGPILDMDGFIDAETNLPLATGVYLG